MSGIYLAARYSRHPEMRRCRDELTALGYQVTSRWIDCHNGALPDSLDHAALNGDPAAGTAFGQADVADLARADTVISFTTAEGGGKGGRHVEFGLALGLGKHLVIVGPRENVFHALPGIEVYDTWEALLTGWAPLWPLPTIPKSVPAAVEVKHPMSTGVRLPGCPDCGFAGPHTPVPGRPDRVECGGGGCGASWDATPGLWFLPVYDDMADLFADIDAPDTT